MLPLDDLLVLDLSRILSGPFASMLLGDFGARIVKVEHPEGGDDTRHFGPPFVAGESTYFMSINRNKESIAVDMKNPQGRELILALADRADVLLENFRPGALDRLGLSPAALLARNPRLIYASISGFGHSGDPAWSSRPGYDLAIQGMGGLASVTGMPDGPPLKFGTSIADLTSGLYATIGILVALHARQRTGRGQHVDVSMLDGQISLLTYHAGAHFATGRVPTRNGNRHPSIVPYETFRAQDGWFNLAVGNDALFRAFVAAVDDPALTAVATDARFATNAARVQNRDALCALLEPLLAQRSVEAWCTLCEKAGVPAGPILDIGQALAHPQVRARNMVVPLAHPTAGPIQVTGTPVRLADTPGSVRTPPPTLGEHTRSTLSALLNLDTAALDALVQSGAIRTR